MLPMVGVPPTIANGMKNYREVFCRKEGYEHVSRFVTGLALSENKTLQGIYAQQVWPEGEEVTRRAMHAAVFEAGWSSEDLMVKHREEVAADHRADRGREVIGVDWTQAHHERGPQIYGVKEAYDYVKRRNCLFQTVVTAAISNRELIDGLAVEVQVPDFSKEELEYLSVTKQENYTEMEAVRKRIVELFSDQRNRLAYRKRTEMAVEIVRQIENEGQFPKADYAFDNGVLTLDLTKLIESHDKHWVSEIECSRNINWQGQWRRVDGVWEELRTQHPESFRPVKAKGRNGEEKQYWAFTKVVRLKRYGRKRLVIVHEKEDVRDTPRFLLTDALHWESVRVIETWNYRWPVEVFHEFSKQVTGFESAQVRKEEAVNRHFRLSCVAQSIVQRAACSGGKSERFEFADEQATVGQKVYTIAREALAG
ncbi:MAG: IS701 family transposase, partial [Terriglobia bacterium]